MELLSQVNTFTAGMDMDTDVIYLKDNQYRYAENIRIVTNDNGTHGVLQNIEPVSEYEEGIPENETVLGVATTLWYRDGQVEEIGVVLVKYDLNGVNCNKLYAIYSLDKINNLRKVIINGFLEIDSEVQMVCNYESNLTSNVYITDGKSTLKVINLQEPDETIFTDPTKYDITPGCVLLPPRFVSTIAGTLPAGSIQYCYQLFDLRGRETTTAALSEMIPVSSTSSYGSSYKIKGDLRGTITNQGCKISITFMNDGRFNKARLYSIIYHSATEVPSIYILNEVDIPNTNEYEFNTFEYSDTGGAYMSQITVELFNDMVPNEFIPQALAKLDNRLFAANLQESTWDVDYDARAYRCNASGTVVLDSSSSGLITGTLGSDGKIRSNGSIITVPSSHDCINPYNMDLFDENGKYYIYGYNTAGELTLGGVGPNISYQFIFKEIGLSNTIATSANTDELNYSGSVGVGNGSGLRVYTYYMYGTAASTDDYSTMPENAIGNYSSPFTCAKYLGYMRDEIYRFGIIFYNRKNIPSPVHWIGDIRMPGIQLATSVSSKIYPFQASLNNKEIGGWALGIQFTVNNIPEDAVSYEIVRCNRTSSDKTIITQGILSSLVKYDQWGKNENNYGTLDIRPQAFFNLWPKMYVTRDHGDNGPDYNLLEMDSSYYEFVSPEICISKDNMLDAISTGKLVYLTSVQSKYYVSGVDWLRSCYMPSYIYNVAVEDSQVENDNFYGKVMTKNNHTYLSFGVGPNSRHKDWKDYGTYYTKYYGACAVYKYYSFMGRISKFDTAEIKDAIMSQDIPYQTNLEDAKQYAQFIGNKAYINQSTGGYNFYSNHGYCAVLQLDDSICLSDNDPSYSWDFTKTAIANVKRNVAPYGGSTYVNRQTSVYISCGAAADSSVNVVNCWGGDTYLNILDYQNTSVTQYSNDNNKNREDRYCTVCYVPLESSFNLNYRLDDSYHRIRQTYGYNLIQNKPTVVSSMYTQKDALYSYNSAYTSRSGSKNYVPKALYSIDNSLNNTRITCSEAKSNNETLDSWTKFKFANYIDVDSQYGPVTNLKSFGGKLYYWQKDAVGVASVNDRSLITDENSAALVLGTGDVLTRYDYVVNMNGSSKIFDKSIVASPTTLYWYDSNKNEICSLGNGFQSLSKRRNVQTFFNNKSISDGTEVKSAMYDKKYNEVWFSTNTKSLVFNEQLDCFTSFYSHNPTWAFKFTDKTVTLDNNTFYITNNMNDIDGIENAGKLDLISKLENVVNQGTAVTKVFDNCWFEGDISDDTIIGITYTTKTQVTEPIKQANIELREDTYRFAIPREKQIDSNQIKSSMSYLARMRGKYLICDYTFDCNDDRSFKIPYFKTTYRQSML